MEVQPEPKLLEEAMVVSEDPVSHDSDDVGQPGHSIRDNEQQEKQPTDPGQLVHEERPGLEHCVMGTPEREFLLRHSLSQEPEDGSAGEK